ncbi:hypothetical protein HDE79_002241 [Rhodanobacter sp. MP1X3]|nr:hypothetical protein [Rhodanobacter sp. MP1X3]
MSAANPNMVTSDALGLRAAPAARPSGHSFHECSFRHYAFTVALLIPTYNYNITLTCLSYPCRQAPIDTRPHDFP